MQLYESKLYELLLKTNDTRSNLYKDQHNTLKQQERETVVIQELKEKRCEE